MPLPFDPAGAWHAIITADRRCRNRFVRRFPNAYADAQDAWQAALLLAYTHISRGKLVLDSPLDGWLWRTARRAFRKNHLQAKSVFEPVESSATPCLIEMCTQRRAAQVWSRLSASERHAFEQLLDIDDTRRRSDTRIFAVRLRLAARRLTA